MSSETKNSDITRREFVAASASSLALAALGNPVGALATRYSYTLADEPANGKRRVIIDTDPGVDDAFALLLAMRSPELKIEGITPVAGNCLADVFRANSCLTSSSTSKVRPSLSRKRAMRRNLSVLGQAFQGRVKK